MHTELSVPYTFAQTPTYGDSESVLAYHIKKGNCGDTSLVGLNVIGVGYFKGKILAGETKVSVGIFFDELADQQQRDPPLQMIISRKAGGFMAEFANLIGDVRGIGYAANKV